MFLVESPESQLKRYVPEELSECNASQYIEMSALIFQYITWQITFDDFKLHGLYKLMNMVPAKEQKPPTNPEKRKAYELEQKNKYSNAYRLSQRLASFFESNDEESKQIAIKLNYIHNPVPKFRPTRQTFYGPTDQFLNITFDEYRDTLRLFNQFNATPSVEILQEIAAILYRPKKSFHFIRKRLNSYNGDARIAYNPAKVSKRAEIMKYAPIGFLYGVYLLMASFQQFITTAKINWGGKEIDFSILYQPIEDDFDISSDIPDVGIDSVMFMMAEAGTFGSPKELDKTPIWMIFVRMYDIRKKDIEERARYKKMEEQNKTP